VSAGKNNDFLGGEKRAPKMDKKRKERKRKNRSIMTKKGFRNDISLSFFPAVSLVFFGNSERMS